MSQFKRLLSLLLAAVLCFGLLPAAAFAAEGAAGLGNFVKRNAWTDGIFSDVESDDWFYENVKSVYEYGLMVGKGENTFDPAGNVTIAETLTIAARLHSIYTTGAEAFEASDPWYAVYADYCLEEGICTTLPDDMNAAAPRAVFAVVLASAIPDEALEAKNVVADEAIPDVSLTDSYGAAVYKLYRAGIVIGGDGEGTFDPFSNVKRSEVAAILTRMIDPSLRMSVTLGTVESAEKPVEEKPAEAPAAERPAEEKKDTKPPFDWMAWSGWLNRLMGNGNTGGSQNQNQHTDTYTVTFDGNAEDAENVPEPIRVESGSAVQKPNDPTRPGYTFGGWYTDASLTNLFDFKSLIVSNITLYAKWEEITAPPVLPTVTYTVTFEANGGSAIDVQTVYEGTTVIRPADPVKQDNIFAGWYTDAALTVEFDFSTPVTEDFTLYAKWEPMSVVITINDGGYADNVVNRTITGTVVSNVEIVSIDYTLVSANKTENDVIVLDGNNAFSTDILLENGENTFTVTVTTANGSVTTKSVVLKYDSGYVFDDVYDIDDPRLIKIPVCFDEFGEPSTFLVANVLDIYFYPNTTFEDRKDFVENTIGAEMVGYLNSYDMMEALMPNPLPLASDIGYTGETDLHQITEDELENYADLLTAYYINVVESISLEYIYTDVLEKTITNDTWNGNTSRDFWLDVIEAYDAWDYDNSAKRDFLTNITVGVVDNGVLDDHTDLDGRVRIISDDDTPEDHGTHVTGIIATTADNNEGIAGIGHNNISVVFYDGDGESGGQFLKGLARTVEAGARVINFSNGAGSIVHGKPRKDKEIKKAGEDSSKAIGKLLEKGNDFIVVNSAGNGDDRGQGIDRVQKMRFCAINRDNCYITGPIAKNFVTKPVTSSDIMNRIITVAAIKEPTENEIANGSYTLTSFSNGGTGDLAIVAAPGESILSTVCNGGYDEFSGTSMAAPIVTAVTALTWSVNSSLKGDRVQDIIVSSCTGTVAANTERWRWTQRDNNGQIVHDAFGNPLPERDADGNDIWYHSTITETQHIHVVNAKAAVEEAIATRATITGRIVNAVNGQAILGATVIIHKGADAEFGTVVGDVDQSTGWEVYHFDSDMAGSVTLPKLPDGKYTLEIRADGYVGTTVEIQVIPGGILETSTIGNLLPIFRINQSFGTIALSPSVASDQYQVILRWTGEPSDLDSHLVADSVNGGSYHVYYMNMNPSPSYANLDVDDVDYEGPETITITNFSGLRNVKYAVHDYTNRGAGSSSVLSNSGATVTVIKGSQQIRTFSVPTGKGGTEWDVFAFDAAGNIVPLNVMKYCSDPGNVLK